MREVSDIDWRLWSPVDPATLVFVHDDDRVLLIRKKRGLGAGKINGPGGRVHAAESPLSCARREVREELGIEPTGLRLSGEHRFQFVDGYSIHVFVYAARGHLGEPRETAEAIPLWTALDAIPYDEMWEDDRHWLPLVFSGRRFSGRFLFDGDAMLDHRIELAPAP